MKRFVIGLFTFILFVVIVAIEITVASFLLRFSIDRLFDYQVDFLGLCILIVSLMMIKNLIFSSSFGK